MGVKLGTLDISAFKVGSDDCTVYLGTELLYSGGTTPTGYTYTVEITGLEDGDTTDIVWNFGEYGESGVGNGTYTYSSYSDPILVEVENYSQDYTIGSPSITLSSSNPSGSFTFIYQGGGGGGFTHIPQGTDMSQYYNQTITRFKIGDSSFPSGYQQLSFVTSGGSGTISQWGVSFFYSGNYYNSIPCDLTGSDTITSWTCSDSSWQSTTENPFTDLWIEFA